jgi:hypothetical protein
MVIRYPRVPLAPLIPAYAAALLLHERKAQYTWAWHTEAAASLAPIEQPTVLGVKGIALRGQPPAAGLAYRSG